MVRRITLTRFTLTSTIFIHSLLHKGEEVLAADSRPIGTESVATAAPAKQTSGSGQPGKKTLAELETAFYTFLRCQLFTPEEIARLTPLDMRRIDKGKSYLLFASISDLTLLSNILYWSSMLIRLNDRRPINVTSPVFPSSKRFASI
jgi:hypothetical protein